MTHDEVRERSRKGPGIWVPAALKELHCPDGVTLRNLCGVSKESLRKSIEDWGVAGTTCGIL